MWLELVTVKLVGVIGRFDHGECEFDGDGDDASAADDHDHSDLDSKSNSFKLDWSKILKSYPQRTLMQQNYLDHFSFPR